MAKKKITIKKNKDSNSPKYLGLAKKEMNKIMQELIGAGKVTKIEGEKLFKKFWRETEDERVVIKDKLEEVGSDLKKLIDAPNREEFEELKKRVGTLEKRE